MRLHLGIVDVPEIGSEIGTYDLALILEKKYTVFSSFAAMNGQFIADTLAKSLTGSLATIAAGHRVADPFAEGTDKITRRFQDALNEKFLDGKVAGVPTMAALENRSRIKNAKRRSTASFIDQGIFQSQLRTWVTKGDR